MLNELKLLHAYLGGLVKEAEAGALTLEHFSQRGDDGDLSVAVTWRRAVPAPTGCDHEFRRIASGEYECKLCGVITDDLENEQWQS